MDNICEDALQMRWGIRYVTVQSHHVDDTSGDERDAKAWICDQLREFAIPAREYYNGVFGASSNYTFHGTNLCAEAVHHSRGQAGYLGPGKS